ncbi:DapH/DapD/GlmU-related protein [Bifidobacterium pseudolongum]|uniref:DapH/DapD/GlmU-related protein n=1 Tax=Bifidobacterium pseudolongum TaxID=1694 RepID=UPI003F8EB7FB
MTIGDNVLMASNIFITDTSHGSFKDEADAPQVAPDDRKLHTRPTKIGNNVWIGEGACILSGVEIGDGCTIGANAVVTKSIPANSVAGGVPAKVLRKWNKELGIWERHQ